MQESVDSVTSMLGQCGFDSRAPEPPRTFEFYDPQLQRSPEAIKEAGELREAVQAWAEQDSPSSTWLVIAGATGTGKTQLLKTAVWVQKQRGVWSRYTTAFAFDKQVKTFQRAADNPSGGVFKDPDTWVEELASVPGGLVIDDIGAGYVDKGWTKSRFERLFDIRYTLRLPTAVATNLTGDRFLAAVGAPVYSRVSDSSLSRILNLQHCEDVRALLGSSHEQP